jgi:hypothetical protein
MHGERRRTVAGCGAPPSHPTVGVVDGRQVGNLPSEGPGEAVGVEVDHVLEVGLLHPPVHGRELRLARYRRRR